MKKCIWAFIFLMVGLLSLSALACDYSWEYNGKSYSCTLSEHIREYYVDDFSVHRLFTQHYDYRNGGCTTREWLTDPQPHQWVSTDETPATCTNDGKMPCIYCPTCGCIRQDPSVIPALGHIIVEDAAIMPTCTETGLTAGSHCSRCGEAIVPRGIIAAKGHVVVIDPAVEPTLTMNGKTEGSHCERCGAILVAQVEIPKLNTATPTSTDTGIPAVTPTPTPATTPTSTSPTTVTPKATTPNSTSSETKPPQNEPSKELMDKLIEIPDNSLSLTDYFSTEITVLLGESYGYTNADKWIQNDTTRSMLVACLYTDFIFDTNSIAKTFSTELAIENDSVYPNDIWVIQISGADYLTITIKTEYGLLTFIYTPGEKTAMVYVSKCASIDREAYISKLIKYSILAERVSTKKGIDINELITPKKEYISITIGCNIRKQPSYDAETVQWANVGDYYELVETSGYWYKVMLPNGQEGYIPKDRSTLSN